MYNARVHSSQVAVGYLMYGGYVIAFALVLLISGLALLWLARGFWGAVVGAAAYFLVLSRVTSRLLVALNLVPRRDTESKLGVRTTDVQEPGQQEGGFDGAFWSTAPREYKTMYVSGFSEGFAYGIACGIAKTAVLLGTDSSNPKLSKAQPPKVAIDQIMAGVDAFYSDWRNRRILVEGAISYVMNQTKGEEQPEFLTWLREHPGLH